MLLKKFEKYKLKVTVHDCIDQNIYHVDYFRGVDGGNGPLHLFIPEFYGHVKEHNGRNGHNGQNIGNNFEVLADHKKVWDQILKLINEINDSVYVFKNDYHKFQLSSIKCCDVEEEFSEMPVETF